MNKIPNRFKEFEPEPEHHPAITDPSFTRGRETQLSSCYSGAHLCSWAISWLRSSSSLMPVRSTDPVELLLSWGETQTGRVREGREKENVVKKSTKVRTETTRATTAGRAKNVCGKKEHKRKNESREDMDGKEGEERISLLMRPTKQKTQEGNTNTWPCTAS